MHGGQTGERAQDDGERGPGADAEQARLGHRIAGDGLHDRPGHRQSAAGEEAENRAGHALADDEPLVAGGAVGQLGAQHVQRQIRGPHGQRQPDDCGQEQQGAQQEGGSARRRP